MKEKWKYIDGFNKRYQVSNRGRVRSMMKITKSKSEERSDPMIMKQPVGNNGYRCLSLADGNNKKVYTTHRLVSESFIPNPENKPQVNHIDGNKENNNVSNLEWVTDKENKLHAHGNGQFTYHHLKGARHPRTSFTKKDILYIRKIYSKGNYTQKEIANDYNVDRSTIGKIVTGVNFSDLL